MFLSPQLQSRAGGLCELCNNEPATQAYTVSPKSGDIIEDQVAIGDTCAAAIASNDTGSHWRCLEGAIWHQEPAVQALSYRLLYRIQEQTWASEVMNAVELDENVQQWALQAFEVAAVHQDAFGNTLETGDTVVLTQALNVKGTNFTAPKGTVVKRIRLVPDNTGQIEGKINEQVIVILTKYVKKG